VELSVFSVADGIAPGTTGEPRDRYAELLQLAQVADRSGLRTFWVAEHHFHRGGIIPSPAVFLAAAGAQTKRIRLGSLVSVLPFHSPIQVAEEFALLDRLLGGRLDLGVGSGYIPLEFQGFGIDPERKRERFDRSLETILAAFRGEAVRDGDAKSPPVRLNVTPVQQPHPPIWIAVQRREAIPFVAQRGFSLALIPYATIQSLTELGDEVREFRARSPEGSKAKVTIALHLYAGSEVPEARAALQRYLDERLATQSTFFQQKVAHDPRQASARAIEESGFALFGTPSQVVQRLAGFGALGVDEVAGIFDFGGLPADRAAESVRALGPAIR
jgi:alkanesulfonate monooxygenase SsuD/methylene tetrahydromethanopterin reductase-like flavin-dependent oxidoreductase (luciferase family)